MASNENKYPFMADAGLGDVSAVVTSTTIPLGYRLGLARYVNDVEYRLVYNAGNSAIAPGMVASPVAGSAGYSVSVSTVALAFAEYGAVVADRGTVATGGYFWGARRGFLASGLVASAVCVPSGTAFYLGTNGNVVAMPQSTATGLNPIGVAITTILSTTSGSGRNGSAHLMLP